MANSPLSQKRFLFSFGLCWLLLIAVHTLVLHRLGFPWQATLIDAGISNISLLLASLLIINLLRYYLPRSGQYINIFSAAVLLTTVWFLVIKWLLLLCMNHFIANFSAILYQSLLIRFSIGFLILGFVCLISLLWYNQLEQKESEARKSAAEKLTKEAELFKLRQQLQPHFLFNSLNSINALIGIKPEEARKMVQQLSDFLRGTLKKEETQWVTLQEELQYLQLYLDIEKVRFGNRLTTQINVAATTNEMKLPALLLQPIMENAIKFGLYDTIDETTIKLTTAHDNKDLLIIIENPFDPTTSSPKSGAGFGLNSVKRRLDLLFARKDLLSTSVNDNIFTTIILVPQPMADGTVERKENLPKKCF